MRLIQALLCHVCVGYDIGYEIGHKIGYDIGYDIGHKIRYDIGYDIGYPGTTMTYMHWNTSTAAIPQAHQSSQSSSTFHQALARQPEKTGAIA